MSKGPFTPEGEHWVLAGNGQAYWPAEPQLHDVDLGVIAWSLAQKVRFGGHGRVFYSVAQHSLNVASIVDETLRAQDVDDDVRLPVVKHALFHDAHEAYLADLPSPLKKLPWLEPQWRKMEDAWDAVIFEAFEVESTPEIRADVKQADLVALYVEGHTIMPTPPGDWKWPGHGADSPLIQGLASQYAWIFETPMSPDVARTQFLALAATLGVRI